jgi:hypothetical protein
LKDLRALETITTQQYHDMSILLEE